MLGDVQIEFIQDLGVLIIKGNRRDVEKVQKIIAEIEKQSESDASRDPSRDVGAHEQRIDDDRWSCRSTPKCICRARDR